MHWTFNMLAGFFQRNPQVLPRIINISILVRCAVWKFPHKKFCAIKLHEIKEYRPVNKHVQQITRCYEKVYLVGGKHKLISGWHVALHQVLLSEFVYYIIIRTCFIITMFTIMA